VAIMKNNKNSALLTTN